MTRGRVAGLMRWGTVAVMLAVGGCQGSRGVPLKLMPAPALTSDDYEWALDRWTRSDKVYRQLDSIAFIHVTFHAPEFRKAFALRHKDVYGPGSEEASRVLMTRPEGEAAHEFFMSVATTDVTWNDFDQSDSIWRVTLQGDDREPVDAQIERIKVNANLRAIYPFITPFAKTYALRFSLSSLGGVPVLTAQTKRLALRIASALGTADMVWELVPMITPPTGQRPAESNADPRVAAALRGE